MVTFTQPFTLSNTGAFTPPRPQGAIDGGFSNLVFFDDFTNSNYVNSQLSPSSIIASVAPVSSTQAKTITTGYMWYMSYNVGIYSEPETAVVDPAAIATGQYASTSGGIVTLSAQNTVTNNNTGLICTIPGCASSITSYTQLPAAGHWKHMYCEAHLNYNPAQGSNTSLGGWPAWWSFTAETGPAYGFSYASNGSTSCEVDFMEAGGGTTSANINHIASSNWFPYPTGGGFASHSYTGGWCKVGMLWSPPVPPRTAPLFTTYFNDVVMGSNSALSPPVATETNNTLFLILGAGDNYPLMVDWVAVWQ